MGKCFVLQSCRDIMRKRFCLERVAKKQDMSKRRILGVFFSSIFSLILLQAWSTAALPITKLPVLLWFPCLSRGFSAQHQHQQQHRQRQRLQRFLYLQPNHQYQHHYGNRMCKAPDSSCPSSSTTSLSAAASSVPTTTMGSWMANAAVATRPRRTMTIVLSLVVFIALALVVAFCTSMSFRRTFIFWRGMAPIYLEYKWIKWRKPSMDPVEYETKLHAYYERSAESLVKLILRLGGIATKIGQVLATIGQGILPNEIVVALRVLQNGVPAKSYDEVAAIVTQAAAQSSQRQHGMASSAARPKMDDLFEWFDPKPIGAASIAQAHLARLKTTNETVVVKVQYPEIAKQLDADLWNMEKAVLLISPENKDFAHSLRERHERELDFTLEADHLRECANNLQTHGVEPHLVRIPRVRNETGLCSTNILVMEYIPGIPLSKILEQEQERLARALGKSSAAELQRHLTDQLSRVHGDAQEDGATTTRKSTKSNGPSTLLANPTVQNMLQKTAPVWTRLFRTYASVRDGMDQFGSSVRRAVNSGSWKSAPDTERRSRPKVNLSRVLNTLVHVHGLQMLMDGVYNADPHPGNILVMPDGRLGLLDYGMIGRFSEQDRRHAVDIVLALADGHVEEAASIYTRSGYKVKVSSVPGILEDPAILHRFATFHWDRIDLSPVTWASTGETQEIMQVLEGVIEPSVPPYIEGGRRLGALMMGPHIQSGRTFSLAKSWKGIAQRAKAKMFFSEEQQLRASKNTTATASTF